jgi:hypothetical protein
MSKRSFFLIAALGLIASLAFGTPSQAGSTVTLNSTLEPIPSGVTSITALDITLTGTVPIVSGSLDLVTPSPSLTGATIGSTVVGGNTEITITIPSAVSGAYIGVFGQAFTNVKFVTSDSSVTVTSTDWVTNAGTKSGSTSVSLSAVPEPASMALLGIGMAGFFAFRRFFNKRNASV